MILQTQWRWYETSKARSLSAQTPLELLRSTVFQSIQAKIKKGASYYSPQLPRRPVAFRFSEGLKFQVILSAKEKKKWSALCRKAEPFKTALYYASKDLEYLIHGIQERVKWYVKENCNWDLTLYCEVLYLLSILSILTNHLVMIMLYKLSKGISI